VIKDLKVGTGAVAKRGNQALVHEVGVIYSTGRELESSWQGKKEIFPVQLGSGQVIDGWEKGLPGMRVGGRRELIIPSKLAYGKGAVIYVFDLLELTKP
jgi:peptidylprolyl isomerase